MNLKKATIIIISIFVIILLSACQSGHKLKTPIERALKFGATTDAIDVAIHYSYGSGSEARFFEKKYRFYPNDDFQMASIDDSKLLYYHYYQSNKAYRVYEHESQYFYEENYEYFKGDWHLSQLFETLLESSSSLINTSDSLVFRMEINGSQIMSNYPFIDTLVKEMTGIERKELIEGLDEITIGLLLELDPEFERIVSMSFEVEDYLRAINKYGLFENNLISLEFAYDIEKNPLVTFQEMMEDDAASHPTLKAHTMTFGAYTETNLQYKNDSDMIHFVIDTENTILRFDMGGVYSTYSIWVNTPFGFIESHSITSGYQDVFSIGDYYIMVKQVNGYGVARIKASVLPNTFIFTN